MARKPFWTALVAVSVILTWAYAYAETGSIVDVKIISDSGAEFSQFRTYLRSSPGNAQDGRYFYLEAVKGNKYSIQVANRSDRRVAVVIAVDGRNIITGRKSDLRRNERMYVIGPYETDTFEGWRTGLDRTNRFYFTEPSDSYAEKVFADGSAMGTIALAVYRERVPEISPHSRLKEAPAGGAPSPSMEGRSAGAAEKKKDGQAGTGFGETNYSPARIVQFDPEHAPAEKVVLKYEWRSELCRKGVIPCGPGNRFWPGDREFAPIPKDFRG